VTIIVRLFIAAFERREIADLKGRGPAVVVVAGLRRPPSQRHHAVVTRIGALGRHVVFARGRYAAQLMCEIRAFSGKVGPVFRTKCDA
jgi:hypothetical protein